MYIAENIVFYFSCSASFKNAAWHSIMFLSVSKLCPDAMVCQPYKQCHCTPTGTDEVSGTAVQ